MLPANVPHGDPVRTDKPGGPAGKSRNKSVARAHLYSPRGNGSLAPGERHTLVDRRVKVRAPSQRDRGKSQTAPDEPSPNAAKYIGKKPASAKTIVRRKTNRSRSPPHATGETSSTGTDLDVRNHTPHGAKPGIYPGQNIDKSPSVDDDTAWLPHMVAKLCEPLDRSVDCKFRKRGDR